MRNIYNITVFELMETRATFAYFKQWFIDWCDSNLSRYESKRNSTNEETPYSSYRYGIVLDESDGMLFLARWSGEWEDHEIGPFTEDEMRSENRPQMRHSGSSAAYFSGETI